MSKPGAVHDLSPLGIVIESVQTAEQTGGAYSEFEVSGRPRGFLAQPHVHPRQTERIEILEGSMRLTVDGRERLLGPGDVAEIAPGTKHSQLPHGEGPGRVRIRVTPAGDSDAFFARLAELSASGEITRVGFPKPVAAARLVLDFADEGHAAVPPLGAQRAIARAILRLSSVSRAYEFTDEWDVAAPPEAVFDALADARTYPQWWKPVYLDVDADGEPAVGKETRQHFKGRFPYHLHTRTRTVRLERPHVIEGEVDGDLRGTGVWTLTPAGEGATHVRFDWTVHADRPLLRVLTPVLRPAFRWNHAWAIARAMDGLEPYVRRG